MPAAQVTTGTTSGTITGLDHVLVGVQDLEAARETWRGLGFTISPRGRHIGWGTANYCIMFPGDYIELLGIVDPTQFTNNLDRFLEEREGLLGLALRSRNVETVARALTAGGVALQGVEDLARTLELPEGAVRPAFKLVRLPQSVTPGVTSFVCQHLTPELVWQDPWLKHDNGARAIAAVTAVVADPSTVALPYGRLFGFDRVAVGEDWVQVDSGRGTLIFTTQDGLGRLHPWLEEAPRHPAPWLAALRLATDDLASTAAFFSRAAIAVQPGADGALSIAPTKTCGVILEFAEA
jgi:catechol 2,3-dioxygenase-like lactoylglutathione lyase family enzyme